MKLKSNGLVIFGVFFLCLGLVWLFVIYKRGRHFLAVEAQTYSQKYGTPTLSNNQRQEEKQDRLKKRLLLEQHMPENIRKTYIPYFGAIIVVELVCGLLYVLCGLSLLRGYPLGRWLVILTLFVDMILKSSVVIYENFISIPLQHIFHHYSLISTYFFPADDWGSRLSLYLSGLKLIDHCCFGFSFVYVSYLLVTFFFFTLPKIIAYFQTKGKEL